MIAWSIFAVGGVYVWAGIPLIAAAGALAAGFRPRIASSVDTRWLDLALVASAVAIGLQIVSVPPSVLAVLSPKAQAVRTSLVLSSIDGGSSAWHPLSLTPAWTAYALGLFLSAMLVFWTARQLCAEGGAHSLVVAVSVIGLGAAVLAIVQQAENPWLIYGLWTARDQGARPFGPFVNRNHFATWMLMAFPLAAGYVAARVSAHRPERQLAGELATLLRSVGSRTAWVGIAAAVMTVGLVASTSRSGLIALTMSIVAGAFIGRRRLDRRTRVWGILGVAVIVGVVLAYVNLETVLSRVEETLAVGAGGRPRIWQETLGVARDFWRTGTGLGSFQRSMLVYQQTDRSMFVNQAHNQYLQLFAEGGLLVAAPALLAVAGFLRLFVKRLAADTSPSAWLRVGGMTAIIAVAVQSIWETGLRMPANGVLFAVAAAIAVHRPSGAREGRKASE